MIDKNQNLRTSRGALDDGIAKRVSMPPDAQKLAHNVISKMGLPESSLPMLVEVIRLLAVFEILESKNQKSATSVNALRTSKLKLSSSTFALDGTWTLLSAFTWIVHNLKVLTQENDGKLPDSLRSELSYDPHIRQALEDLGSALLPEGYRPSTMSYSVNAKGCEAIAIYGGLRVWGAFVSVWQETTSTLVGLYESKARDRGWKVERKRKSISHETSLLAVAQPDLRSTRKKTYTSPLSVLFALSPSYFVELVSWIPLVERVGGSQHYNALMERFDRLLGGNHDAGRRGQKRRKVLNKLAPSKDLGMLEHTRPESTVDVVTMSLLLGRCIDLIPQIHSILDNRVTLGEIEPRLRALYELVHTLPKSIAYVATLLKKKEETVNSDLGKLQRKRLVDMRGGWVARSELCSIEPHGSPVCPIQVAQP